jgi:DNA topoisomerase-3
MVPERFEVRGRKDTEEQLGVLRKLLRDPATTEIVNACDAGREGELIFRWVLDLCGVEGKPLLRLWTSSLTDAAISAAWAKLAPASAYDRLGDAARCRAESDWLVGLNATRALTCRAREAGPADLLSVGRVQTPTLAMIVARDREISAFVPETFYRIDADFAAEAGAFEARFFRPDVALAEQQEQQQQPGDKGPGDGEPEAPNAERLGDQQTAEAIAKAVVGRTGTIEHAERKRTRERPPLLYDLTSLQRRANQRYGLSAQQTLDVAQALYERHKLITYPRTDSRYITPDQVVGLPDVLRGLEPVGPYAPFVQTLLAQPVKPGPRVVNASEVGDHPAILPTGRTPPAELSVDEKRVFDLVARRLLAALSDDALFDQTKLVVAVDTGDAPLPEVDGKPLQRPLRFRASGRVCAQQGWRAVDPPGGAGELELPPVAKGDPATATDARAVEGQTRPPRHYNDASVLRAMETAGKALDDEALARALRGAGLGTPATRASILQTLLDRQYVERRGREIVATSKGATLIDAIPIDALKSAELTASWEGRLSEMADGRGPERSTFMADVAQHVQKIVAALAAAPPPTLAPREDLADLGPCPQCGRPVRALGRVYRCDSGRSCPFVVFASMAKRTISARAVKQLLHEGRSPVMKGFRSKAGRDFEAGLRWDAEAGRVVFWFDDSPDRGRAIAPEEEDEGPPAQGAARAARAAPAEAPAAAAPAAEPPGRGRKRAAKPRTPKEPGEKKPRKPREPKPKKPKEPKAAKSKEPKEPKPPPPALPRAVAAGDPCPTCGTGSVIRGRTALGCSRWREGCGFRHPLDATAAG